LTRRLQSRLGADVDLNAAAAGFRNLGQFVAAVNNSSSPDQFWKLRAAMTGYNMDGTATGQPTLSLGQAKQKLGIADTSESTPTGGSPTTTTSSTTRTSK
jgi:hypothetical protein